MNWDDWIELDNHYLKFHADKARRIAERGNKCYRTADEPQVFDGAVELLEELCGFLPERYPTMFVKTAVGMDNVITNESFDIRRDVLTCNGRTEDPMCMAARMTQDDLAIMFERADGQYYLLAGAILLAGFWRLEDKLGMPLSEIHTRYVSVSPSYHILILTPNSGDVPGYKDKLEKGMMNFFRRVKPDGPVQRNNYFIQVDDDLAWSHSIGSEDAAEVSWDTAQADKAIEHHFFRSERQSVRRYVPLTSPLRRVLFLHIYIFLIADEFCVWNRLPRSGGCVFTIRTYFHPITEIAQEPYVPGRLASAIRSWGDDVSKYKGGDKYKGVLLRYLDQQHEKQVAEGLDVSVEEEVRKYPF